MRKPLVIVAGQIEQLQSGDTIDAPAEGVVSLTNANASPITIGMVVYSSATGSVDLASAAASGTMGVIGLVYDASIAAATPGGIITSGVLTSADWTAVVGTATLTSGSVYYLSDTVGKITATPPTAVGHYVVPVGRAISTTELKLNILDAILL
jgi:predicted RecA/RadA family phage recombinase